MLFPVGTLPVYALYVGYRHLTAKPAASRSSSRTRKTPTAHYARTKFPRRSKADEAARLRHLTMTNDEVNARARKAIADFNYQKAVKLAKAERRAKKEAAAKAEKIEQCRKEIRKWLRKWV